MPEVSGSDIIGMGPGLLFGLIALESLRSRGTSRGRST